jgi:twitching motility protein PilT
MGRKQMSMKEILAAMIETGASDLHLVEGNPPSLIINDDLAFHGSKPLTRYDLNLFLDEIVEDLRRKEKLFARKELDFAYELEGKARFRIHAYFQRSSVAYSVRMIPLDVPGLERLRLPGELRELAKKRSGLIFVVGPAKSGKSTTAAAMVNIINEECSTHITTIEDPIEYVYKQKKCVISQREVNEDTLSVANALRHILRQSPGVVVVDVPGDKESVKMVLEAAENGHLVICTLRAWNVVQSISKLVDYFPEGEKKRVRTQISHTLKALISQRLLRRKDGRGFVAACEVLRMNDTMRELIREDQWNKILGVMDDLRRDGMLTLNDQFAALYKEGLVDLQEIADNGPGIQGFAEMIMLQ